MIDAIMYKIYQNNRDILFKQNSVFTYKSLYKSRKIIKLYMLKYNFLNTICKYKLS